MLTKTELLARYSTYEKDWINRTKANFDKCIILPLTDPLNVVKTKGTKFLLYVPDERADNLPDLRVWVVVWPEHLGHLPLEEHAGLHLSLCLDAACTGVNWGHSGGGGWHACRGSGVLFNDKMELIAVFETVILKSFMDRTDIERFLDSRTHLDLSTVL